jgi:hypothetical protein
MKTTVHHIFSLCLLACLALFVSSCKKEDDKTPTVQEKVTGINIALNSEKKGALDVDVSFKDAKGLEGKTSAEAIIMDANSTYTGALSLEDASKNPAKDVTADYEVSFHSSSPGVVFSINGRDLTVETSTPVVGTLHMDLKRGGKTQRISFPLTVRE